MPTIRGMGLPKVGTTDLEDDAVTEAKLATKGYIIQHVGAWSTVNAVEEELATYTAAAGDFADGDRIAVHIDCKPENATNSLILRTVETATSNLTLLSNNDTNSYLIEAEIMQRPGTNTELNAGAEIKSSSGAAEANTGNATGGMTADWIQQAFVISLRGSVGAAATFQGNWSIYKLKRTS